MHDAQIVGDSVTFTLSLPDGDAGFPGNRTFAVTYTLTDEDLRIDYKAVSDKKTVINPTNHSYFNLAGEDSGSIAEQVLKMNSSFTTKVKSDLIPTGEIVSVEGTPFDFREGKPIGRDIDSDDEQMRFGSAYALETQFFPDNVHHDNFPKAIFGPGKDYASTTIYRFPACR